MSLKHRLLSFSNSTKSYVESTIRHVTRNERNVDIALRSILQDEKILSKANDAASYVELLRAYIEPAALPVVIVKSSKSLDDVYGKRFKMLLETIQSNLLPLPIPMALELTEEADRLRGMTAPLTDDLDLGLHFVIASSLGHKGLRADFSRLCRSERCLELGTAHGMSATFMLGMQPYIDWKIHHLKDDVPLMVPRRAR